MQRDQQMEQLDVVLIRLHSSLKHAPEQNLVGKWIKRSVSRDFKIAKGSLLNSMQEQVLNVSTCVCLTVTTRAFEIQL